jgi:hypothetical protein
LFLDDLLEGVRNAAHFCWASLSHPLEMGHKDHKMLALTEELPTRTVTRDMHTSCMQDTTL